MLSDCAIGGYLVGEMDHQSDAQLLLDYARLGSEAAFGEFVARHADLVYSAALRQVNSADIAQDVAQTVFIDLARKARSVVEKLPPEASLVGWLYRSTRFATLNLIRCDQRRQAREKQAMENLEPVNPAAGAATDWEQVRPVLDEAISTLGDQDRDALLLRFFTNQDFHAVGLALGVSDDAAQKRVSRALEKLRHYLARRGLTTTTAALSVAISGNAVQTAPVGLVATLSSAAVTAAAIPAAALAGAGAASSSTMQTTIATKVIAMAAMHKTIIGAVLAAAIGTSAYEARQASHLREQLRTLQQQQAPLAEQIRGLRQEREDAKSLMASMSNEIAELKANSAELMKLRGEVARLRGSSQELAQLKAANAQDAKDPVKLAAYSLADRAAQLKEYLRRNASASIPEVRFAATADWLNSVGFPLEGEKDFFHAVTLLRQQAMNSFSGLVKDALNKFRQANPGQFPAEVSQLRPYCDHAVADTLVQLYEVAPATEGEKPDGQRDWWTIRRKDWPSPGPHARFLPIRIRPEDLAPVEHKGGTPQP